MCACILVHSEWAELRAQLPSICSLLLLRSPRDGTQARKCEQESFLPDETFTRPRGNALYMKFTMLVMKTGLNFSLQSEKFTIENSGG